MTNKEALKEVKARIEDALLKMIYADGAHSLGGLINAVRKLPARTRGIIRRLVEDAARMVEEGVGHDRV
jgi:hypothetical protein